MSQHPEVPFNDSANTFVSEEPNHLSAIRLFNLQIVKFIIQPFLRDQTVVISLLGHNPFVKDNDLVGVPHGGETVGYDDRGAVAHEVFDCVLDEGLGEGVDVRGGLVEHQDRGVGVERPRECAELPLPGREGDAAFHHHGVGFLRQGAYEPVDVGRGRNGGEFAFVKRRTEEQVLLDAARKQEHLLHDHCHGTAQGCVRDVGEVHAVDGDGALLERDTCVQAG
jgi:hypothetical protein